jgi:glycosyltransferase involved in cell wall biosynthesis
MVARGHSVGLLTLAGGVGIDALRPEIEVQALPHRNSLLSLLTLDRRVRSLLRRGHWTTVHIFSCLPSFLHFSAMVHARRAGLRVVWTPMMHPARSLLWRAYPSYVQLPMRLFDVFGPHAARFVDVVAASTDAEARYFAGIAGRSKVKMVPPAVDDAPVVAADEASRLRRDYGIGQDPMVLVVCARDEQRKGLAFGVAAFAQLRRHLPDAKLAIAGLDRPSDWVQREGILLLGRLTEEALRTAYRAADVTFVPSRYEAFSRVVLEAWQQGSPVLCTDRVGLADQVRMQGGIVVPFGDRDATGSALATILMEKSRLRNVQPTALNNYLVDNVLTAAEEVYA